MPGTRGRADAGEYAVRVNAAADLLASGSSVAECAQVLASRFGISVRQAHRYAEQAAASGPTAVPESMVVFTVKLPAPLVARVVETEFVFDRHAATDLSVAFAILVPHRRARVGSGQEGRSQRDQRGDLRPGVLCPAEEGRDDRQPDRGAARARAAVGA